MELTPDHPPDDGMLRMSGIPLRGRTILAAFGRSRSPWPVFALSGLKQLYVKN